MTDAPHALTVAAGFVLILLVIGDATSTLIRTGGRTGRWRPTYLWYASTWRVLRATAARLPARASDFALNIYPSSSVLGLLVLWLTALTMGWALVFWGLGERPGGTDSWGMLIYYAGTSLLTPAFGAAHGSAVQLLSLVETLTGLGTIALVISYLPALYGAYNKREARLLTLDDPLGGRLTPSRVIAVHAGQRSLDLFYRFCADWEMWTADVLESHVSYPMLALFRSQHPGQSWITALGVVTDAATLATACIVGADLREPYFLHRRGMRAVVDIAERLNIPQPRQPETWLNLAALEVAWAELVDLGLPLRDKGEAWERLQALRAPYGYRLQQLIDFLLAPHGFWGDSAEATVAEEVERAAADARLRARTRGAAS